MKDIGQNARPYGSKCTARARLSALVDHGRAFERVRRGDDVRMFRRVVVRRHGQSGIVARKIAATLSSTGTPSVFLHPAEAVHGDLGMLVRGDVVIALSTSGETEELLRLLASIKRLQVKLISITGDAIYSRDPRTTTLPPLSTLASAADVALDCSVEKEACGMGLAPTTSTTAMLALGDALAMRSLKSAVSAKRISPTYTPDGKLGKKLARVHTLMHGGEALPVVAPTTRMRT